MGGVIKRFVGGFGESSMHTANPRLTLFAVDLLNGTLLDDSGL